MVPFALAPDVAADVSAVTYPAFAPRLDVAWAAPYGVAYVGGDASRNRLSDITAGALDLRFEPLVQLGRHVALGPWISYGFVDPSSGCGRRIDIASATVACDAHGALLRAGVALELRARPHGGPWVSLAAGVEQIAVEGTAHVTAQTATEAVSSDAPIDARAIGFEIGRFAAGWAFASPTGVEIGPTASVSVGRYLAAFDESYPLMIEPATHGWISVGLRIGWDR